jgi:hypothetical protein
MFSYTVAVEFDGEPAAARAVAAEYEAWLVDGHLADVVAAGAREASMVRLDGERPRLEAHYLFADAAAFARYEQGPAAALRADGLARFPPSRGVRASRRTGERVAVVHAKAGA